MRNAGDRCPRCGATLRDSQLRDLLTRRNASILAHGLQPIDGKTYSKLYRKVHGNASKVIPN